MRAVNVINICRGFWFLEPYTYYKHVTRRNGYSAMNVVSSLLRIQNYVKRK